MDKIDLQEFRRAAVQGDGAGVVAALKGWVQTEVLQLGGDCLFVAVRQKVPGLSS